MATTRRALVTLLFVAVACSAWNWLELGGLLQGDNVRWMSEAARAARGELIYRDFASMYPPLGLVVTAGAYRLLGTSFVTTELVVCLLSAATVLVTFHLARRFVSQPVALGAALVLACAGATNPGNFALFSLQLYTPGLLVGCIGLGLTLIGTCDLARGGGGTSARALAAIGTNVALLSKIEHALAALVALGLSAPLALPRGGSRAALRRSLGAHFLQLLAACLPALGAYAWLMRAAGRQNVIDGLSGYGIASQFCPAWPTGLGLFGAAAGLGQAAALLALLALVRGRRETRWRWAALLAFGAAIWTAYLPYALENFALSQPGLRGLSKFAAYQFSFNGLLGPVMWASLALFAVLAVKTAAAFARTAEPPGDKALLVLLAAGALLASRGLFGHMFGNAPIVHQSSYMIWFVSAPYLLLCAVRWLEARPPAQELTRFELGLLILVAFAAVGPRTVATLARRTNVTPLVTEAGKVRVADRASREAYAYVVRNTTANDRLLESPLGGGLSFASGRQPATHTMQFYGLLTPERLMQRDVAALEEHPPALVIASTAPRLGSQYGICAPVACTFPNLVWRSTRLACEPQITPAAIAFVLSRYSEVIRFDGFTVLRPGL